jgi:polyisoprenoid-binding protein YceI
MELRSLILFVIFFVTASVAAQVADSVALFKINTDSSTVVWTGRKIAGEHTGLISIKEGDLLLKNGILTGGNVAIDMKSIIVTDLKNQGKETLEHHLKSDDFFDVEIYPVATLLITDILLTSKTLYTVYADLMIKGVTQPIHFDAVVDLADNKLVATSSLTIDRTMFNVRYGSGKFFKNLGDKIIYDDFELDIRLVASPSQ